MDDLHLEIRRRIETKVGFRSIRQLARDAGIPYSTLHQQITECRFSLEVLWRLADALQVDARDLIPPGPGRL